MEERDYQALMEKYGQPADDDKVVAMLKKKYRIKGDWHIPSSNFSKNTRNPDEYFIDKNQQDEKLNGLGKLLSRGGRGLECSV
jgi:hypothetical protein